MTGTTKLYPTSIAFSSLVVVTIGLLLSSSLASADNNTSVVDEINITVPVSCTLSGTGMNTHNANINNGQYDSAIGETTMKAFCNDNNGFAIYAIGFTDNEDGKNVLTNSTLGSTYDIETGTAITGNDSQWAMKLSTVTGPTPTYPIIIAGSTDDTEKEQGDPDYTSFQEVPDDYTLVAKRTAGTDIGTNAEGATLKSTYQAYISKTQPAGTYTGQVKYTLIHPSSAPSPVPVSQSLYYSITGSTDNYTLTISDSDITSSAYASGPVAIDGGYTYNPYEGGLTTPWSSYANQIKNVVVSGKVAPISTSFWFAYLENCESWDLSGLKTDNITDMSYMFNNAGFNATTFNPDLSSWNTSSVINMAGMFYAAGSSATTWSISSLSSLNTSSVTNMADMFHAAGSNATTFILDLTSWNTSNVTDMSFMFAAAGENATTWSVGNLSSWNTSSVTTMFEMFSSTGRNATTWSVGNLSSWKTSNVVNMAEMFAGAGRNTTNFIFDLSSWDTSNVMYMSEMFWGAGYNATTFILDLSSWNTSDVIDTSLMFSAAGYSATTFTLNLSSWNTSNVTNMYNMFSNAGYSATTWSITIPQTNGNNINNTTDRLYGQTTSIYNTPPTGKSFTLAQP